MGSQPRLLRWEGTGIHHEQKALRSTSAVQAQPTLISVSSRALFTRLRGLKWAAYEEQSQTENWLASTHRKETTRFLAIAQLLLW